MTDKEILIEQVLKLRDAHENGFIRLYGYLLKFELESYSEEELQKILSRANIICRIALAKTCGYYDGTVNKHPWDQYKPELASEKNVILRINL